MLKNFLEKKKKLKNQSVKIKKVKGPKEQFYLKKLITMSNWKNHHNVKIWLKEQPWRPLSNCFFKVYSGSRDLVANIALLMKTLAFLELNIYTQRLYYVMHTYFPMNNSAPLGSVGFLAPLQRRCVGRQWRWRHIQSPPPLD